MLIETIKEYVKKMDLSRLSTRERVIAGLTALALIFVFVAYILAPKVQQVKDLKKQRATLQAEVDLGLARIPVLQKQYEELRKTAEAQGEVPESSVGMGEFILLDANRLSVLLEEVTHLARLRQIEFVAVRPEEVEDRGAYLQLPIQIEIRGRYRPLGEYLEALEGLSRGFIIENMKIETPEEEQPLVIARLMGRTFLGKE